MFSKQNRGLWECAFCTPLYTLTGKEKTSDKTQLSACFPWGMKRLNSLHHSLGAWKTKNNPMSQGLWPSRFSWFSWFSCVFFVFFLFFSFFCILQFFWFSDLSLRSISSSGLRCVCFHMSAWRNPWSTRNLDSWEGPLWTKESKLFRFFRLAGVQTNF